MKALKEKKIKVLCSRFQDDGQCIFDFETTLKSKLTFSFFSFSRLTLVCEKKCWMSQKLDRFQKLCATTPNKTQTEATCNIQKCWELFANNVASNCKELFIKRFVIYQCLLRLCWDLFETFHFQFREMVLGLSLGSGIIKTERH